MSPWSSVSSSRRARATPRPPRSARRARGRRATGTRGATRAGRRRAGRRGTGRAPRARRPRGSESAADRAEQLAAQHRRLVGARAHAVVVVAVGVDEQVEPAEHPTSRRPTASPRSASVASGRAERRAAPDLVGLGRADHAPRRDRASNARQNEVKSSTNVSSSAARRARRGARRRCGSARERVRGTSSSRWWTAARNTLTRCCGGGTRSASSSAKGSSRRPDRSPSRSAGARGPPSGGSRGTPSRGPRVVRRR